MEDLELRIQKLEKKCRTLTHSVAILLCFAAYAGFSGAATINRYAQAQQTREQEVAAAISGFTSSDAQPQQSAAAEETVKIPAVVEAQVFVLKDDIGRIRGVWSADDQTTSFAMMHKDKYPIAAISVDQKNASLSLTDVYKGKINLSLVNSVRSISITDDSKDNNIYMGLTGNGEASIDLVSTGESAFSIDGAKSRIDMTGDKSTIAMSETVGSTIALQAQPSSSLLSFIDHQGNPTVKLSTIDGKSQLNMKSPATKEEKTITTAADTSVPEEAETEIKDKTADSGVLPMIATPVSEVTKAKGKDKETPKADEKKAETPKNSILNMKTYSPFGDK